MLVNIQLLRGIAALLVVLFHSAPYLAARGHDLGPIYTVGLYSGFGGVDIFFVISGFIMAWTTPGAHGVGDALDFLKRRGARIFSGYWPFLLLYLALFAALRPERLTEMDLLRSALLWPAPLDQLVINISWTLIFELYFYVLFAVAIVLLGPRREALMLPLLAVLTAGFLAYGIVFDAYSAARLERMSVYENYWAFPFLLQFLAGAALGDYLLRRPQGMATAPLLAGIGLWLLTAWLNANWFDSGLTRGDHVLWRVGLFGAAALLIVTGLARLDLAGRRFVPAASMAVGGASYAIYLSHPAILLLAQELRLQKLLSDVPSLLAQASYLLLAGLVVAISLFSYRRVERPLQRLLQRGLRVRSRTAQAHSP